MDGSENYGDSPINNKNHMTSKSSLPHIIIIDLNDHSLEGTMSYEK